jgi:hypothetical protein
MDNLGAIGGPLLALALVALIGTRATILVSIIPGLLAALAILYAIRNTPKPTARHHQPIRLRVRPLLHGWLGGLLAAAAAFELVNLAATLMILRATDLLEPGRSHNSATQLALVLYAAYNLAATLIRRNRREHPTPRRRVRPRRDRDRLCRDRTERRRRATRARRLTRLGVRAALDNPSRRQPRRQRHRRHSLDRDLARGRVHLRRRMDGPRRDRTRHHRTLLALIASRISALIIALDASDQPTDKPLFERTSARRP